MILRQLQMILNDRNRHHGSWYQISLTDKNTAFELIDNMRRLGYEVRVAAESGEWTIRFKR